MKRAMLPTIAFLSLVALGMAVRWAIGHRQSAASTYEHRAPHHVFKGELGRRMRSACEPGIKSLHIFGEC